MQCLKTAILNKLDYWEFPCGITSWGFFGKYPPSGQFGEIYSDSPFYNHILAIVCSKPCRQDEVMWTHSLAVWEMRKGITFLSEWIEMCK